MNSVERYNLLWLANAMTLPSNYVGERYYYDSSRNDLFYLANSPESPHHKVILNKLDLQYAKEIEADIAVRLEMIDDESNTIVEIPRLNTVDKVDIQLQFLSRMPGTFHHNELIKAIEQQKDDYKFVLDTVLIENDNTVALAIYWDNFKLQVVFNYIQKFCDAIGFENDILDREL